jgi:PAS domain S-box-containing protein
MEKEIQQSEAKFRNAIENLQEGFALFDRDDRLVIWNRMYEEIFAFNRGVVRYGVRFEDLVKENMKIDRVVESVGRNEEFLRERMEQHQNPLGPFELRLTNGTCILVSEAKTPDGGTYTTLTDITKLKQTEKQAREREAELANIRRLNVLGEMAAAIAHELNQPLTVISSYAQGVAAKLRSGLASPDDLLEPVENLIDQANRAGEIIGGIRSLIDKQETRKSAVDLNAAIEEALTLVTPEYQELGIGVTLDLDDGLPWVLADEIQAQQLLLNLARNAMEAMSEGPCASSRLTVQSSQADGDTVEVAVMDTGPGFPFKDREGVFEPFFTTKAQGLGLGLSICRSITEAFGGRIWIESAPGTGALVRFSLPIADVKQLEDA